MFNHFTNFLKKIEHCDLRSLLTSCFLNPWKFKSATSVYVEFRGKLAPSSDIRCYCDYFYVNRLIALAF